MTPKRQPAMRVINERTETVPIDSIRPHERNVNDGDRGAVYESIRHNGFWGSVIVQQSSGKILAGKHRWLAAKDAGATDIPATFVDVDDDAALRIMLADNRTTRLGHDDDAALAELLQELAATEQGMEGTGFDGDALDELLRDLNPVPPDYGDRNRELDADDLLGEGACKCPRCGFEFEP